MPPSIERESYPRYAVAYEDAETPSDESERSTEKHFVHLKNGSSTGNFRSS